MTDDTMHSPAPEFREQLEWEIARTYRRHARLGVRRREQRTRRLLRAAAIVVACLGIGVASGLASAQVRDVARRDSLLEAAQADLRLIELRHDLARANVLEVLKQFKVGTAGTEAVAKAQAEVRMMEARLARAMLNIKEIQETAQPPRDELTAPRVGARDFVQDRIQLDLAAAQGQLSEAERALADAQRRVSLGIISQTERAEAEIQLARAQAAMAVLLDRRTLRSEFVEKGTPADELAGRLEAAQLRQDLIVAQELLHHAKARLETIKKHWDVGTVTRLELMRAEVELRERELEMEQLLLRRQRLLEAVKRDPQ